MNQSSAAIISNTHTPESLRKVVITKIAFSAVLLIFYVGYARLQQLHADLDLALVLCTVPVMGLIGLQLVKKVEAIEHMLFYLRSYSILCILVASLLIDNQTEDFQIRVAMLYAILYFIYVADFLYIDKWRFPLFIIIGCSGVFFLPVDLSTRVLLLLALMFMTLLAFDTVSLRQNNAKLVGELRDASEEAIYKLSHYDVLTGLPNVPGNRRAL